MPPLGNGSGRSTTSRVRRGASLRTRLRSRDRLPIDLSYLSYLSPCSRKNVNRRRHVYPSRTCLASTKGPAANTCIGTYLPGPWPLTNPLPPPPPPPPHLPSPPPSPRPRRGIFASLHNTRTGNPRGPYSPASSIPRALGRATTQSGGGRGGPASDWAASAGLHLTASRGTTAAGEGAGWAARLRL